MQRFAGSEQSRGIRMDFSDGQNLEVNALLTLHDSIYLLILFIYITSSKVMESQEAKTIGSTSIIHRSNTFAPDRCLIEIDPIAFAYLGWVSKVISIRLCFACDDNLCDCYDGPSL